MLDTLDSIGIMWSSTPLTYGITLACVLCAVSMHPLRVTVTIAIGIKARMGNTKETLICLRTPTTIASLRTLTHEEPTVRP